MSSVRNSSFGVSSALDDCSQNASGLEPGKQGGLGSRGDVTTHESGQQFPWIPPSHQGPQLPGGKAVQPKEELRWEGHGHQQLPDAAGTTHHNRSTTVPFVLVVLIILVFIVFVFRLIIVVNFVFRVFRFCYSSRYYFLFFLLLALVYIRFVLVIFMFSFFLFFFSLFCYMYWSSNIFIFIMKITTLSYWMMRRNKTCEAELF